MMHTDPPLEITDLRNSGLLRIVWADGRRSDLPHTLLRERCRCAACTQAQRSGTPVEAAADVRITAIAPVADRGLNFVFSDGHGRGIYPWRYLNELASTDRNTAEPR